METKRILVTGAAGFLGYHVIKRLESEGHEVIGFDIAEPKLATTSFVRGDFTSREQLQDAMKGVNAVCHLGGVGDVYLADRDPALAFQANAYGTLVVCDCCASSRVDRMVYASTWEVYGQPVFEPVKESHPCNPESPYSISKLAGDLIARRCSAEGKVNVAVLRLGTAYGPHMRKTAVIMRFIDLARTGKSLVIEGTGNQFRQFTHASDIARAFAIAISTPGADGVFNIVSKEKVSILQLARAISEKYSAPLEFRNSRRGDPPSVEVSSERALKDLGWAQSVSFSDGLTKLITQAEKDQGSIRKS